MSRGSLEDRFAEATGKEGWHRIADLACALLAIPHENERIGKGLNASALSNGKAPMLHRMREAASRKAGKVGRQCNGGLVPSETPVHILVPVKGIVDVAGKLQALGQKIATTALRNVSNALDVDRSQPGFSVVVGHAEVRGAVARWAR